LGSARVKAARKHVGKIDPVSPRLDANAFIKALALSREFETPVLVQACLPEV